MTGFLEVVVFLPNPTGTAHHFLLPAMLFYSVVWSVVALAFGVTLWLACRLFNRPLRPGEPLTRWYLAVLIPLGLFVIAGGHINMRYLPSFTDGRSLLFDAVFLAANVLLGLWLYRHGVGWGWRFIRRPSRRLWWALSAGGVAIGLVAGSVLLWGRPHVAPTVRPARADAVPNVLLIAIDALRPDHVSAYGYERRTTPSLDQLAREGARFTEAYANSSWTKTSVPTMLASIYPSAHNVHHMASGVPESLLLLPEVLQLHGYATGIFSANSFVSPLFGFDQGVEEFYHEDVSFFKNLMLGHILASLRQYSPAITWVYRGLINLDLPAPFGNRRNIAAPGLNKALLDWVRTLEGRPFFAYMHYMEPHTPYAPPAPFDTLFDPAYRRPYETDGPISEGFEPFERSDALTPQRRQNLIAQYDGEIAYVDQMIGELFRRLKELGLYERTVVIITADHAETFYEHGGWGHGKSLFNEVLRVPLLIRYPTVFPAGTVVEAVARHVDLMPTILELCSIAPAGFMEGTGLVSLVQDPEAAGDARPVYSELLRPARGSYGRAVQDGDFKLIEVHTHDEERWLLFDLAQDPGEQHPLDVEAHPMGPPLKELLASFQERAARMAVAPKTVKIDRETRDRLRAVGYLH
ncbi:MAG: sulfatase-like hydrolase/transferase [Candidatus Omnitrophica bacterium]|nr:sulfatase-like hydrolase/transferase [Candidatus Omnitrophota bacterium]